MINGNGLMVIKLKEMNIKNKKMYEYIIATIIIIIGIIYISRGLKEQKIFKHDLLMTGNLTIGAVTFYKGSGIMNPVTKSVQKAEVSLLMIKK